MGSKPRLMSWSLYCISLNFGILSWSFHGINSKFQENIPEFEKNGVTHIRQHSSIFCWNLTYESLRFNIVLDLNFENHKLQHKNLTYIYMLKFWSFLILKLISYPLPTHPNQHWYRFQLSIAMISVDHTFDEIIFEVPQNLIYYM